MPELQKRALWVTLILPRSVGEPLQPLVAHQQGKSFWIRWQTEALIFTTTAVPRASLLDAFCPS
jgi:hypothetical protein